ncbi:MAG TPA: hypothetical protein VIH00_09410, partial [Candidatus Limnocylindrales bacterium]
AGSAASADTNEVLVTVEGHHDTAADNVARAIDDLDRLLREHTAPRSIRRGVLTVTDPSFE